MGTRPLCRGEFALRALRDMLGLPEDTPIVVLFEMAARIEGDPEARDRARVDFHTIWQAGYYPTYVITAADLLAKRQLAARATNGAHGGAS